MVLAVRIGFIGAGTIAAAHLVRMLRIPGADVVALCDLNDEQIEATRAKVNQTAASQSIERTLDAAVYTDYRTMLKNERLDAVYVCLPPFVHGDPEEAVIEAGAHLFVEKPVALDLALASGILEKLRAKDLISSVGYQLRYLPSIDKAKELASERTVGMVVAMRFGGLPGVPWYPVQEKSGGQLVEQATHHVDQLRYILGEVDTVYAAGATRIHNRTNPAFDIFDVNCMTMTFANGVVANFANNTISGHASPAMAKGVHIFCDGMTISHALGGPLQVITAEGVEEFPDNVDAMLEQNKTFVQAVADGRPDLVKSDYLSGVLTLAVTLAGERSARQGRPIRVMDMLRAEAPYVYSLVANGA